MFATSSLMLNSETGIGLVFLAPVILFFFVFFLYMIWPAANNIRFFD